ncbi:MAG: hypothetical protein GXY17_11610 [Clostridiaceae bacterium]|jgi:hypothetical protein|nr:hypothetical protein [Clostridiaceae bacterium]NLV37308.1 hypothetical protein [Clostridiaceae bacterium]
MPYYQIADISMSVETSNQYIIDRLKTFLSQDIGHADLTVEMQVQDDIQLPMGEIVSDEITMKWIKKNSAQGGYFAYLTTPTGRPIAAVDSDSHWTRCKVFYQGDIISSDVNVNPPDILSLQFLGIAFRNYILFRDSVVLHASCIEYQGKGIAFSAPSGTGKSTHVSLWEQYKGGTRVINDDAPVIRMMDGKPILCGTPWSGSSDKYLNVNVPLTAIVILERDSKNSIRFLNSAESVTGLLPRLLLPYHDAELMELAISTFEKILAGTPVYHLKCRPDVEAVELVYQCIK